MSTVVKKIENILTSEYSTANYVELMQEIFDTMKLVAPNNFRPEFSNFSNHIKGSIHVGNYVTPDKKKIAIFAVQLKKETYVENSRSTQRSYAKKLIEGGNCDAAIVAFFTEDELKWRLSFVRLDYEMKIENGKLKQTENLTPAKRYSFLVGKNEPCHTAIDRFRQFIISQNYNPTLDDLEEAFSVEKVTDEFFNLYCEKYHQLREQLEAIEDFRIEAEQHNFTSAQFAKKLMGQIVFLYFLQKKGWLGVGAWPNTLTEKEYKNAYYARGAKSRELIPIVYRPAGDGTYHVSGAGLQSISDADEEVLAQCVKGKPWGTGPHNFMRRLFEISEKRNNNFYNDILEPLFYDALNRNRGEQGYCPALHCRIPFLSGGLFEPIDGYDWEHNQFDIPNEVFSNAATKGRDADGILDIFDRYNFTMSEDEPMEREVAIDPEMLGKVFENLLEVNDRKSKGAFYTPREIVHYMCQESLINYLCSTVSGVEESDIRDFILYGDFIKDEDTLKTLPVKDSSGKTHMEFDFNKDMKIPENILSFKKNVNRLKEIDDALKNVRVADPAVGSGAFPLGMLNEIVRARQNISAYMAITMKPYDVRMMYQMERSPHTLKYETIRNCIFAADIEPSAVDIAQLRLWLALVIDDEINPNAQTDLDGHRNPLPLPNLESNILCGNSLIDEFEGVRLIKESDLLGSTSAYQLDFTSNRFDSIITQLIEKQDALFRCDDTIKKHKLTEEIKALRNMIIMNQLEYAPADMKERFLDSQKMASKPYVLWQLDFARVFREKGGFDIVIGNPPYKLCQPSNTEEYFLNYYKKHYCVASYKIDLFHLFFEKGIALVKHNGVLSYITPNTYLTNKYIKPLRKHILDNCLIHKIINHDKVFDSASVDTATIVLTKNKAADHNIIVMHSNNYVFTEICRKHQADWAADSDFVFNINAENVISVSNCKSLGDICKTYFGIQAYDRKSSISDFQENDKYLPFIDGADIHPYSYATPKIFFNYLPENIKSGGDWGVYSRQRIVIRQIGQIPVVGLCEANILGSNTLYSVYPKDSSYDLRFLLACLNSAFIQNFWKAKYSDNKALFPKIKGFQLKELPIPNVTLEQQQSVISLVDAVLAEKADDYNADTSKLEDEINALIEKLYTNNAC